LCVGKTRKCCGVRTSGPERSEDEEKAADSVKFRRFQTYDKIEGANGVPFEGKKREAAMKNSSKRASGSPSNQPRKRREFDLGTANRMLPLVRSILTEIANLSERKASISKQLNVLDEFRQDLTWASRQKRYQLQDDVRQCETALENAADELKSLGVKLQAEPEWAIQFPTRVNDRPAYFVWKNTQEKISIWQFSGEALVRPVPPGWYVSIGN
jgi:hypothetical protein